MNSNTRTNTSRYLHETTGAEKQSPVTAIESMPPAYAEDKGKAKRPLGSSIGISTLNQLRIENSRKLYFRIW